jgi:hypothetical protein
LGQKDRDIYARHFFTRPDGYVWAAYDSGAGAFTRPNGTRHPGRNSSSPAESSRALPRICTRESEESDVVEAEATVDAATPCSIRHWRRPGKTISTSHKNYHLMLNLQLGIRYILLVSYWYF